MKAEKYMQRMPHKSIEAFARVYATIEVSDHALVEKTKERCRTYFDAFGVTEKEVQEFEKYFLE
ncbi:MAG: hypothetical protein U9Q15_05315 [Patescibacteria group bacterium]|nr:hypothetical protein [Patescibacteria group bacterium]